MAQTYEEAILTENEMRAYMYSLPDHPMFQDQHYDLIEITEEWHSSLGKGLNPRDGPFLFSNQRLNSASWVQIKEQLVHFDRLLKIPGLFIAGGSIFSLLFNGPKRDIDLFLYDVDPKEAMNRVLLLFEQLNRENRNGKMVLLRTQNALTFKLTQYGTRRVVNEYQVVLRLYKTKSEILHGFDVDSCCLGYDSRLWMTPRCKFALEHGYNTVNFERLSPSYEWRLVKYANRGLSIMVPGMKHEKINHVKIEEMFKEVQRLNENKRNMSERYHIVKKNLRGLNILLYMEYHCQRFKFNSKMATAVDQLSAESSDYDPIPHVNCEFRGQYIDDILYHIMETAANYPQLSSKYMSCFTGPEYVDSCITDGYVNVAQNRVLTFKINSLLKSKSIDYVYYGLRDPTVQILRLLCDLPERLYEGLGIIRPWKVPRAIEWKVTNPGEQMTNTFNQIVLIDREVWYKGEFYG